MLSRWCLLIVSAVALGNAPGCASTKVATVWMSPTPPPVPFESVVALVVNASSGERRAGEDAFVRSLPSSNGVAGYTLVPDEDLKDKEKVRAALERAGIDGAAVIRLVASNTERTYVRPSYGPSYDLYGSGVRSQGYTVSDRYVTAEVSVHSVRDGALVWAGSSETVNPSSVADLVTQVSRASVKELRRQGLLR